MCDRIREHSHREASRFKSVWLLNGNAFYCLCQAPALSSFKGWLHISIA